jgi:hypothetical protein
MVLLAVGNDLGCLPLAVTACRYADSPLQLRVCINTHASISLGLAVGVVKAPHEV